MISGIDKNERFEYISPMDKSDPPTKFTLGCLPARQRMSALLKFEGGDQVEGMCDIVRFGVMKIVGLKVKGEAKDFDAITDEVIDMLPVTVIKDLFVKILSINTVTEEEAKN